MNHICSECGKAIGLMAGIDGKPVRFKCIHTGRWAKSHIVVPRKTPPLPKAFDPREVLRETMTLHGVDDDRIRRALTHAR